MKQLEEKIGYEFKNRALLLNALTHSSYANENRAEGVPSNERLEFLGDSVLGFAAAKHLYSIAPSLPEGKMTRLRAELVCEHSLYGVAKELKLGEYLRMGHGEEKNGGRERASILADATEAVIAAIFLDGGIEAALSFVERMVLSPEAVKAHHASDYKTELQELVQRRSNQHISYELIGESGPDHCKTFTFQVCVNGLPVGEGSGRTKKEAEQQAAGRALEAMRE